MQQNRHQKRRTPDGTNTMLDNLYGDVAKSFPANWTW
jgi:hypothetical protein